MAEDEEDQSRGSRPEHAVTDRFGNTSRLAVHYGDSSPLYHTNVDRLWGDSFRYHAYVRSIPCLSGTSGPHPKFFSRLTSSSFRGVPSGLVASNTSRPS